MDLARTETRTAAMGYAAVKGNAHHGDIYAAEFARSGQTHKRGNAHEKL